MADAEADLAELYDLDYGDFDDDLSLYENLARRGGGPLLELGAGTGRAAIPLARAGFEVWGIDASEAMLARARCKAGVDLPLLHLEYADMRDFRLGREFALVFAGLGGFHHLLTTEDQLSCLRCVAAHLAPEGLLVYDLRPLQFADWDSGASPLLHDWTRQLARTGETVTKFRSVRADRAAQLQHEVHMYDCLGPGGALRRLIREVDLRFSTRYELELLLDAAGLVPKQFYGDFDLAPYNDASEYLITIASRSERSR